MLLLADKVGPLSNEEEAGFDKIVRGLIGDNVWCNYHHFSPLLTGDEVDRARAIILGYFSANPDLRVFLRKGCIPPDEIIYSEN